MVLSTSFVVWDFVVFGLVLAISLMIGVYFACSGNKQRTPAEYHLGNRSLQTFPVIISVLVTSQSSILIIGIPAEVYKNGFMVAWTGVAIFICHLFAARFVVPLLHPLKLTTIHEYYQIRYKGKAVRVLTSFCDVLINVIYMGVVTFGQSIAMESVTGIPVWLSILLLTMAAVAYTSIGGIKAVVWTDCFQCVMMFAGILSIIIKGTLDAGGVSNVWKVNVKSKRLDLFEFRPDPYIKYTVWSVVIGSTFKLLYLGVKQTSVQRMNACRTKKQAQIAFVMAGSLFILTFVLGSTMGVVAYAYFEAKGCDPIKSKLLPNPNQLIPFMVVDMFKDYPGVPGLFLAAVASASLSSLSSSLASIASITQYDIIKPYLKKITMETGAKLSKMSVVVSGILSICVSFLVTKLKGSVFMMILTVQAVCSVPLFGVFLYSTFFPSATTAGAISGSITGAVLIGWLNLGSVGVKPRPSTVLPGRIDKCWSDVNTSRINVSSPLYNVVSVVPTTVATTTLMSSPQENGPQGLDVIYQLSYLWFDIICLIGMLIIAILLSFIVNRVCGKVDPDPKYIFSFGERLCPCLPYRARRIICCGDTIENMRKQLFTNEDNELNEPSFKNDGLATQVSLLNSNDKSASV